jgi:hypothetical protein
LPRRPSRRRPQAAAVVSRLLIAIIAPWTMVDGCKRVTVLRNWTGQLAGPCNPVGVTVTTTHTHTRKAATSNRRNMPQKERKRERISMHGMRHCPRGSTRGGWGEVHGRESVHGAAAPVQIHVTIGLGLGRAHLHGSRMYIHHGTGRGCL